MKKLTKIKEGLFVNENVTRNRTTISVIDNEQEILLSDMKTWDTFWNKWDLNHLYIISYSRGCMENQIPLNVEAAYSINDHQLLELDNKTKRILEYMIICKRSFDLAQVLSEINETDLGLLHKNEKDDLNRYLTSGNINFPHEKVVEYILKVYPQLKRFANLGHKLSVAEFRVISSKLDTYFFSFHAIEQDLSFLKDLHNDDKEYVHYPDSFTRVKRKK